MKRRIAEKGPYEIPCVVSGELVSTGIVAEQLNPGEHKQVLCKFQNADQKTVQDVGMVRDLYLHDCFLGYRKGFKGKSILGSYAF